MNCPYCNSNKTRVIDTRKEGEITSRVRCCDDCRSAFTTRETWVEPFGTVEETPPEPT